MPNLTGALMSFPRKTRSFHVMMSTRLEDASSQALSGGPNAKGVERLTTPVELDMRVLLLATIILVEKSDNIHSCVSIVLDRHYNAVASILHMSARSSPLT